MEHTPRSAAQQHHAPPPQVRPTAISREAPTYIDGAGASTAVAPHACGFDAAAGEAHARSRRRRRRRRLRSSTITARTLSRSHCWWGTHLERRHCQTTHHHRKHLLPFLVEKSSGLAQQTPYHRHHLAHAAPQPLLVEHTPKKAQHHHHHHHHRAHSTPQSLLVERTAVSTKQACNFVGIILTIGEVWIG